MGIALLALVATLHFKNNTIESLRGKLATEQAAHATTRQSVQLALVKIEQQNADARLLASERDAALKRAQDAAQAVRKANASAEALAVRLERDARPVGPDGRCVPSKAYQEARQRL